MWNTKHKVKCLKHNPLQQVMVDTAILRISIMYGHKDNFIQKKDIF